MSKNNFQPKISSLLISLLAPFSVAIAQGVPNIDSQKPQALNGATGLQYTGASTRIGVGFQNGGLWRGEIFDVLTETSNSAWLGEAWVADSAGGVELSYHLKTGETVNKYFVGVDQNKARDRKLNFGTGFENNVFFTNVYLSYSPSKRRQIGADSINSDVVQTRGLEAGREFIDSETTITTTRLFEQAYKYGLGTRIGRYYEEQEIRLTAGLDFERGVASAKQWGASLMAEKFFVGTPHSVALQGEVFRKSGSFDKERNDNRFLLMYRYSFGGAASTSRQAQQYRDVAQPVIAAPPVVIPAHTETKLVKTSISMNGDAFFQISSAKLTDIAKQELDRLAEILKKNPHEGNVRIIGHTCDLGSASINLRLSIERANAVRDYFLSMGVLKADEIIVEGKGKSEPKYPAVAGTREKNRRVDLEFISVQEKEEIIQIPEEVQASPQPTVTYKRELIEQEPVWLRRSLRTPAEHKRTIDTYHTQQKTQVVNKERTWVNRAPQAVADTFQVAPGVTTNLSVLSNDSDADVGDILSLVSVTAASQGSVRVQGNQLVFTAPTNFIGQVTFSYVVTDNHGATATAGVVVNVVTPNHAPVAGDDQYRVSSIYDSELNVLANDTDSDGDVLNIVGVTQPVKKVGTVSILGNKIKFIPNGRFDNDTFTYTISDGKGGLSTATVTLIDP